MLTDRQFRDWTKLLQEQIKALDAMRGKFVGASSLGNPEVVAFLQVDDAIVKEQVERAVSEFAKRSVWPDWLNMGQIVNLTHRATLAQGLLTMMQNGQLMQTRSLMPTSRDRGRFLRWLFIELWQYGGADYLQGITNSYFVDNSPPIDRSG